MDEIPGQGRALRGEAWLGATMGVVRLDSLSRFFCSRLWLLILLFSITLAGCTSIPQDFPPEVCVTLDHLKSDLIDSSPELVSISGFDNLRAYASTFTLDSTLQRAGYLSTDEYQVFVSTHHPPEGIGVKGSVLVIHGYTAHGGHMAELTSHLVNKGWRVWLMDLPGHGMSTGGRYAIDDFRQYAEAVRTVWVKLTGESEGPFVMIGHSTGCTAILELLIQYHLGENPEKILETLPRGIILGAPLIDLPSRELRWVFNRLAGNHSIHLTGWMQQLAAFSPGVSTSDEYIRFTLQGDPLYEPVYHPSWLEAYIRWVHHRQPDLYNGRLVGGYTGSMLLIQGTADTVVEWERNIEILTSVVPEVEVGLLKDYPHTIFNMDEPERGVVFDRVSGFLSSLASE